MSGRPDGVSVPADWVLKAEEDLAAAEKLLSPGAECPFAAVGFHAQQCVEKYVKAMLVCDDIPFPKTHDIAAVAGLLPQGVALPLDVEMMERLTDYATVTRYPGGYDPVTREDAEEAVEAARRVREAARNHIPPEALGTA
jgi:HEPN domain-containing protein